MWPNAYTHTHNIQAVCLLVQLPSYTVCIYYSLPRSPFTIYHRYGTNITAVCENQSTARPLSGDTLATINDAMIRKVWTCISCVEHDFTQYLLWWKGTTREAEREKGVEGAKISSPCQPHSGHEETWTEQLVCFSWSIYAVYIHVWN